LGEGAHGLNESRRYFPLALDGGQLAEAHLAGFQGLGQHIGRDHRVLDRIFYPRAGGGSHGVGGIANEQQSRPIPAPAAAAFHGQE